MWRYVSSDVISAIAGRTVMFSFRFHPASVVADGSQNNARAEIYYEYSTGGGGGGCPYVSTWNGYQYVLDNNLMPSSESSSGNVRDYYLLQQSLVSSADGSYSLLLSEFEEEHSFFDQVQLLAVDHSSSVSVAASPYGEILTFTSPSPPNFAVDNRNQNVKRLLSSMDGNYYEGYNGSYVTLNFGDLDVSRGAKLVIRSDFYAKSPVYIQTMNSAGMWRTVATIHTRSYWATDIVDMAKYLPDGKGKLKVRLLFTSNDKIDFVGLDTSSQAGINVQQGELTSAIHFKNGDPTIPGGYMGEGDVKTKLLHDDGIYGELLPSEQIELAFTLPEVASNLVRDFIFVSKGRYSTLLHGTLIDPTVYGVWVAPTELKWHDAYVTVTLPSNITVVKAIIHGTPDFRAYVDVATLTIFDYSTTTSTYGKLALGVNVYEWRQTTGISPDGKVTLVPALYAEASGSNYGIIYTQIKVELLPNDGSSTSQEGILDIGYTSQGNNEGYEIDPAKTEEVQVRNLNTAAAIITFGTGVFLGWGVPLITGSAALGGSQFLGVFTRTTAGTVIAQGAKILLHVFASDPNVPNARKGTDYFALEQWDYPTWIWEALTGPQPWFVSSASGQYSMEWKFNSGTSGSFQIRITASVYWGEIIHYFGNIKDHWTLNGRGWSQVSRIITIYA
jgi:hypothetical protein